MSFQLPPIVLRIRTPAIDGLQFTFPTDKDFSAIPHSLITVVSYMLPVFIKITMDVCHQNNVNKWKISPATFKDFQ